MTTTTKSLTMGSFMRPISLSVCWLILASLTCVQPAPSTLHFVIMPNVLRLETDEVVTLTALEAIGDVTFKVSLLDHADKSKTIYETNVTVPEGEASNVTVRMGVADLPEAPPSPFYVILLVETVNRTPHFKKEATLLVNESPGYIFIQTDKPIYTPDQSVMTRIMVMNEMFRPMNWPVQVDIQNPEGMTISRQVHERVGLITKDVLKIPHNPVYGNWTVTAKFLNGLKTTSAVRFEVKEYTLPTFAVSFHIPDDMKVILPNATEVRMAVRARYMYGKPVKGHVSVTFGLLWHGHVFIVGKQRNLQLNESGYTECRISTEELRLPVQSVWFPNGGKLHVQAAVTEAASGRIERADDVSVVFSDHLYVIKFTRSSRFFKPGLPYMLEIEVYKANGEQGANLELQVECKIDTPSASRQLIKPAHWEEQVPLVSDGRGKLSLEYSVPGHAKGILFTVSPRYGSNGSEYYFHASPFFSPANVYMQVHARLTVPARRGFKPRVGDYLSVTTQYTSAQDITTVNLVVISRGRIVWQVSTKNIQGNATTFHFILTQAMSPGSRILAFSVKGHDLGSEVISDSVWIDVEGKCDGELSIVRENEDRDILRPGDIGTVTLSGLPHTLVGVVAVDSAVYQLKNSSLTRDAVFQGLLDHDRGCGCCSGKDTSKVFENAGLTVLTDAGLTMPDKLLEGCVDKMVKKKKRSVSSKKRMEAICCHEGVRQPNASLAYCYHASQELKKSLAGSELCALEFFRCCRQMVRGELTMDVTGRLLALEDRTPDDLELTFDEDSIHLSTIPIRSNFPESWWFEEYNLGPEGKADVDFALPDSITTWSVQAVGVSQQAGLCVAPPLHIVTFSSFFVHLDLPYSVVRLEQLEVRATVYNYMTRRLRVKLMLESVDGVCYSGQPGRVSPAIKLEIDPNDAGSAYFPIVPLEIGEFPVRVLAFSSWGRDAVEKTLRVEGEGLEKIHTVSVMLDPSGKRFLRSKSSNHSFSVKNEVRSAEKRQSVELDLDLPEDVIPDTDSCTVHAMGDLLGPTVHVMIEGVTELLRLPTGCGEQNLIYLAPNVYVTRYLASTRRLLASVEKKAFTLIRQGVARQMTFRKPDASYGTWPHADSSTWLTAFAMKTLCQAEHYVSLDHDQTCSSFQWVASQQETDGSFKEKAWVTHREMLGGVNGDVSHAAYILIALLECDCDRENRSHILELTQQYIESKVKVTDRPLALAISAYALTLAGSRESDELVSRLESMAKSSPEGFTYWGPGTDQHFNGHEKPYWYSKKPGALAVEITAYALLTFLARGDVTTGTSIVGWLLQQRNSHGAFISTQDTVVGLQALSEYSIKSYSAILDMTCHIRSEVDDRFRKSISLTPEDAMVLKSVPQVPTGGKLHFEAEGTGVGLMQVEVRFNVPDDDSECRFEVKVATHQHNTLLQSFFWDSKMSKCEPCSVDCEAEENDDGNDEDDFENFTFPPIMPRIQTNWRRKMRGEETENESVIDGPDVLFGSKIGRPKRSAPTYSSTLVCLDICVRYLGAKPTGMAVVDAGLFTGYVPVMEDLEILKVRGKIDHYEKSQRSVVLYLNEISSTESTCLKFRAKQEQVAENLQPAKVQVFDYYNPDERCTVFYKSNNQSGQLVNFCDNQKQICQCLESRCAHCEEGWHGLGWMDMIKFACNNASYVLEVKAFDRDLEKAGFERLLGQIKNVIAQKGVHELKEGDKVILLKRASCFCPRVTPGRTYLMMLSDPKRFKDADGNQIYAFLLDKRAFVIQHQKPKGLTGSQKQTAKNVRRTIRRLNRRGCAGALKVKATGKRKRSRTRRGKRIGRRRRRNKEE